MSLLVFDSGIGGLGVVEEIRRQVPAMPINYLADNDFYPYGEKPDALLTARIVEVIGQAIARLQPLAVVVACNTASTIALVALRAMYNLPFIGCVPPVKPAAMASRSRHIGLLATPATIRRPYLQELVDNFAHGCTVHSLGTPVLADLAEKKFRGAAVDVAALAAAVAPLFESSTAIDAVALGCTHYRFLLPELQALYPNIAWFDPAAAVARQALRVAANLPHGAAAEDRYYTTAPLPDATPLRKLLTGYGFAGTNTPDNQTAMAEYQGRIACN